MSGPAIQVESLVKRFGRLLAVDGIDLAVPEGSVLGLLGPNGAGKTTTVRILTTLLLPDSGRASVLGHDVCREPQAVRASIGLAGQYAAVDENLTGRENLRLVGRLTHQPKDVILARTAELLEDFDIAAAADRPVRTYSGGMRRRLDLAAALVHRPPVLFLDEPTTGLDPRGRNDLWAIIEDLVAKGMTVLLTTQYLEEAERLAKEIVVIDGGRVIAKGTATELKRRLGATIIEVRFLNRETAARARRRLEAIGSSEVVEDGLTAAVTVTEGGRAILDVVRALDAEGLTPEWLTVREPTLDDVFLQLTGRRPEVPADDGSDGSEASGGDAPFEPAGKTTG
jgi:ABC-2 type transport system ATP-binding protein